jgi:hypothetical protein
VAFDRSGLEVLTIDGKSGDCCHRELGAIVAHYAAEKLDTDHPAWFVAVGQFR